MNAIKKYMLSWAALLLAVPWCHAQEQKLASIEPIIRQMEANNSYQSATLGVKGVKSKQYVCFEQLAQQAKAEELLDLAETHPNAVVRLYAYKALKQRAIFIPASLTQKLKRDRTIVSTFIGCARGRNSVAYIVNQNM
jgi:hypothetical protein